MTVPPGGLRFEHVTKRFEARHQPGRTVDALRDVTLEVEPGTSVGLIGANGAGKSTLLKVAAGITAPTSGRVLRSGRTLAVIELGAGIHPDLSGLENLQILALLATQGEGLRAGSIEEIVAFSGLDDVLDRPARHYSTGMVARLAFSVAVHADPAILLVDEVISVGDLQFQQRSRQRIFDLRSQCTTVVMVSHDHGLILETCERTVLLTNGAVDLDGDTDGVVRHYLGRPARDDQGDLVLVPQNHATTSGTPLLVDATIPQGPAADALRLEVVVPGDASARAGGRSMSAVYGATKVPAPAPGPCVLSLGISRIPPGRYELRATLEGADRRDLAFGMAPFTIVGPPGPMAIRLDATAALEGRALEARGHLLR